MKREIFVRIDKEIAKDRKIIKVRAELNNDRSKYTQNLVYSVKRDKIHRIRFGYSVNPTILVNSSEAKH